MESARSESCDATDSREIEKELTMITFQVDASEHKQSFFITNSASLNAANDTFPSPLRPRIQGIQLASFKSSKDSHAVKHVVAVRTVVWCGVLRSQSGSPLFYFVACLHVDNVNNHESNSGQEAAF